MHILPILERELRVGARKRTTYQSRVGAAALMMLVTLPAISIPGLMGSPRQLGGNLFQVLIWVAFIFAMSSGIGAASDCISAEKREGTLGLLFLTDLTGFDVVMGKLAASSTVAIYSLLAMVPVFAVTLLLGGVTLLQVVLAGIALLNGMFFTLAASLLASTFSREVRHAGSRALGFVLVFVVVLPLIGLGLKEYFSVKGIQPRFDYPGWLRCASPGYAFYQAAEFAGQGAANVIWPMVLNHVMAWGFLGLAGKIVPRVWQDKPATARRMRWRDRLRNWLQGNAARRQQYRTELLNHHPIAWLAMRDRLKPVYPWIFLGAISLAWFAGYALVGREWLEIPVAMATIILLHFVLRMWLGSEAGMCFADNLQSGAWELVLSTSLRVEEILRGQVLALHRQFYKPAIVILVADVVLFTIGLTHTSNWQPGAMFEAILTVGAGMVVFVADMYVLVWAGMWQGLAAKSVQKASGAAVARILFLPWVYLILFFTMFAIVSSLTNSQLGLNFFISLLMWLGLSIANNLFFLNESRRNLKTQFRNVAMRRYIGQPDAKRV